MINNVVSIETLSFRKGLFKKCSVKEVFEMFLENMSERTQVEYHEAINQFFRFAFNCDVEDDVVTPEMLSAVTMFTARKYYEALIDGTVTGEELTASTAAKKIYAISSFWKTLPQYFGDIKDGAWKINIKRDSTPYDTFSREEIDALIEWAKTRGYKGQMLSLWFETSFATGIRKAALCNLKWDEILHKVDRKSNTMVWIIDTVDKGKKKTNTPISDELYAKLKKYGGKGEMVFDLCSKTIDRAMTEFKKEVIKDSTRKLCVHSIKSASIDMAYAVSGNDLQMAKIQGHHASSQTTELHYLGKGVPMIDRPSYKYKPVQ